MNQSNTPQSESEDHSEYWNKQAEGTPFEGIGEQVKDIPPPTEDTTPLYIDPDGEINVELSLLALKVTADTTDTELREQVHYYAFGLLRARTISDDGYPGSPKEDSYLELAVDNILSLIHHDRAALLARVETEVIGSRDDNDKFKNLSKYKQRKILIEYDLRVAQRTALATIKGEEK